MAFDTSEVPEKRVKPTFKNDLRGSGFFDRLAANGNRFGQQAANFLNKTHDGIHVTASPPFRKKKK